jgi:hypothetical protein
MKTLKTLFLTFLICFVTVSGAAQNAAAQSKGGASAEKLLSLGDYYYRSNDIRY